MRENRIVNVATCWNGIVVFGTKLIYQLEERDTSAHSQHKDFPLSERGAVVDHRKSSDHVYRNSWLTLLD
jgi:hypothetical protein